MLDFRTIHSLHREIRASDLGILRAEAPETYASVAAATLMPLVGCDLKPCLCYRRERIGPFWVTMKVIPFFLLYRICPNAS